MCFQHKHFMIICLICTKGEHQRISQIYILKHNGATYWFYRFFSISLLLAFPFVDRISFLFLMIFRLFFSGDDVYWECKGKVDAVPLRITTRRESEPFFCIVPWFLLFHSTPIQVEYDFFCTARRFSLVLTRPGFTHNLKERKTYAFVNSQLTYNVLAVP